jgi:Homeodomain-like domain-containing protein
VFHNYDDVLDWLATADSVRMALNRRVLLLPKESPYTIVLTGDEQMQLEARTRKYTSPYRDVIRAKIVLLAAQGLSNDLIAVRLDTPRQIVSKWRKRFAMFRLPGLEEQPRGGRPARFSPQSRGSG